MKKVKILLIFSVLFLSHLVGFGQTLPSTTTVNVHGIYMVGYQASSDRTIITVIWHYAGGANASQSQTIVFPEIPASLLFSCPDPKNVTATEITMIRLVDGVIKMTGYALYIGFVQTSNCPADSNWSIVYN